jgi:polysaccharide export outer membrane protein
MRDVVDPGLNLMAANTGMTNMRGFWRRVLLLLAPLAVLVSVAAFAAETGGPEAAAIAQMGNAQMKGIDLGSLPASPLLQPPAARGGKTSSQPLQQSEFQSFVATSAGRVLPLYGYDLFSDVPDTFAPLDNVPVTPDYLIGPGDEIVIKGWGQVDIDVRAVVNRNGAISLPKVGTVNVAGIRYQDIQEHLKTAIGKVYRHFELNVSLGRLRTIQVFVVGQARRPGVYTVSSLSTLVNTLFASGGPSTSGSLRHIQVKRNGRLMTELDMYDLLLKGDKTRDIALLPGDVIYIPPVGQQVAIYGSIKNSAIYELKDDRTTLSDLLELAGGMTPTAAGQKVLLERIQDRKARQVEEFALDRNGLARLVRDGDLVQVFAIEPRFENAVTLRGNVASPGRYPWRDGMRVKDLIPNMESLIVADYWMKQNQPDRGRIAGEAQLESQIKRSSAEINLGYATVERLNKDDLTTKLLPFNLGKALEEKDSDQNLLLLPGDTITIFSKDDIQVPIANRSVYVRLEGEVVNAGVYKALPGETLRQLLVRVGGLTPNAYLYGAEFDRESVRMMQQEKLNQMIDLMEEEVQRNLSSRAQNALSQDDLANVKAQAAAQEALVARLRKARATGRIVLEIPPDNHGQVGDLPDLVLHDGDHLIVPSRPSVVNVMGMVYNQNAFLYHKDMRVGNYLDQAGGPTRDGDSARMYLLHADGSVLSAQSTGTMFGSFSGIVMQPGDAIVVPELLDKFSMTKELKDWTQIFYQFALGVAGIHILFQ